MAMIMEADARSEGRMLLPFCANCLAATVPTPEEFCSPECAEAYRPDCEYCGEPCPEPGDVYCSAECEDEHECACNYRAEWD